MHDLTKKTAFVTGAALALSVWSFDANAAAVADFYKDKTVSVYISAPPGGGYDAYGRLLARHLGRNIPGKPTVIPKNMPGSGGRRVASYLYNVAPKDGTAISVMHGTTVYDSLFKNKGAHFDARKLNWLGSIDGFISIGFATTRSGVRTIQDAMKKEIILGATGYGSNTYRFPNLLNKLIGTKFKVIVGYKGTKSVYLAIERGELDGMLGASWSQLRNRYTRWIKGGKVSLLVQLSTKKSPELPNVPLALDLIKNKDDKALLAFLLQGHQMSRASAAPPDIPAARVKALRAAFQATLKDAKFIAQAKKGRRETRSISGEKIDKIVAKLYASPPALVERARKIMVKPKKKKKKKK